MSLNNLSSHSNGRVFYRGGELLGYESERIRLDPEGMKDVFMAYESLILTKNSK